MSDRTSTTVEPPRVEETTRKAVADDKSPDMEPHRMITPARIGEYISFDQCPRYFKHSVQEVNESWYHSQNDYDEAFEPVNLLLSKAGKDFEEETCETLVESGGNLRDLEREEDDEFNPDHDSLFDAIQQACTAPADLQNPMILYQASVSGTIGVWQVAGDIDLLLIWPTEDGAYLRIIDVKSAREEKSYHQIQAAIYADLIADLVDKNNALEADTINIDAGIITRESTFTPPTPETVPDFNTHPRIIDVRRLLAADGKLTRLAEEQDFKDVSYQLNDKCAHCPYNEACTTDAFEDGHIRLLGLSIAQQETLANHGVETLKDLTDLCKMPDAEEWYPTNYRNTSWQTPTYKTLKSISGIGELLPTLVYQAQALLDYLDPGGGDFTGRPRPWIPGTGRCELPEDNPPEETEIEHDWRHGSMVRIYLNVQTDHLRDRLLQLSARITATASEADSQRISLLSETAPDDPDESLAVERRLLESFIEQLYNGIRHVADGIEFADEQTDPPIHFYLYTSLEQTALLDAFERHDTPHVNSFQSLLEGKPGHNRPIVSELRSVVASHVALEAPLPGLLPAYENLYPPESDYVKPRSTEAWTYTPHDDRDPVHLRSAFNDRLFEFSVDCSRHGEDGVSVDPTTPNFIDGVATRMRHGADVPLGYLWAAIGRINEDWVAGLKKKYSFDETELASYRYHDAYHRDRLISSDDVEALGRHFCDALEHVERSLDSRDAQLTKEPYPLSQLSVDMFSPPDLATAAQRYLWIEHTARRKEEYSHYCKFPEQRMLSGKSIPVTITDVEERTDRALYIEGKLRYDRQFGNNAETIRRACRQKGSDGATGGSWMVANRYDFGQLDTEVIKPYEIESGVQATLETLDIDTGEISFTARNYYGESDEYGREHDYWTLDIQYDTEGSRSTYFSPGEDLILDPQTDDITASRAKTALDHADHNSLHTLLEGIRHGDDVVPTTAQFSGDHLSMFADWLKRHQKPRTLPSDEQRAFITEDRAQLVGLQGPPGTGKTGGAFAPAICARAYAAAAAGDPLTGLVTAPSNTAIDELLKDVASMLSDCQQHTELSTSLDSVELVRLVDEKPDDAPENVTHLNYNDEDDADTLDRLRKRITESRRVRKEMDQKHTSTETTQSGQATLGQYGSSSADDTPAKQTIIFATSARSWRFIDLISSADDPTEIADQEYWDLLVTDEASMMTLPQFLLAGAAFAPTGQVLVGGDHRQLPPVQKHDWENESRRDIRATLPYLSTLDYLRLLRGEDDVLDEDRLSDWEHDRGSNAVLLPFYQLSETFRFGPTTATLAQQTVYEQDGIAYSSDRDPQPLPLQESTLNDPLAAIFDDDIPLVLVTYQGTHNYQQWNPIEAALAHQLFAVLDTPISAGVVTPHNAQRSRVQSFTEPLQAIADETTDKENKIQVETVNRFQGGESNLMILSATVSDPQYIAAESDFLLQENRVNVSLTRHRDKLIVLVPQSLLGHIPADPDIYDDALIWKTLAMASGEAPIESASSPLWSGSLTDLLGDSNPIGDSTTDESDTTITVYGVRTPDAFMKED